jgi:hypothetical protein
MMSFGLSLPLQGRNATVVVAKSNGINKKSVMLLERYHSTRS